MPNVRALQLLTDGFTMISCIIVCLAIAALPIINSVNYDGINDSLFMELNGTGARDTTVALVIFGYVFISMVLCIFTTSLKCSALEHQCTINFVWVTAGIGIVVIICTCVWVSYINPAKCDAFEMNLIFQFYSNNTSPNFYRWMRSSKCIEMVECITYAHKYVTERCRVYFSMNVAALCVIIAFLIISLIGITYIQIDEAGKSEEEYEYEYETSEYPGEHPPAQLEHA